MISISTHIYFSFALKHYLFIAYFYVIYITIFYFLQ
nr:MAG TPA: hypothetical protein [Caudoviricetes sp.]